MTYNQARAELVAHNLDPELVWAILDEEALDAFAEGGFDPEDLTEDGQ